MFTPVPPNVGEIIPDKALVPSKGKLKMVWGVVRVVAVFAVRAVVAVLAFPVRSPTKFEELIEAKPVKLV